MEVVSVRYPSLEHHGTAAGVFGSSGQSKAERNDWALALRAECAARGQAVADLSRDNSSFAKVSLGRIIRVIPTRFRHRGAGLSSGRHRGKISRYLSSHCQTTRQPSTSSIKSGHLCVGLSSACVHSCVISGGLRHERIANKERSVAACVIALGSDAKPPHRAWIARSAAKTSSFVMGTLVSAERDKNISRKAKPKSVDAFAGSESISTFFGKDCTRDKVCGFMTKLTCFKAYDIRGRLGDELNDEIAYRIGRAYAQFLSAKRVVIGGDVRLSSEPLKRALGRRLDGCRVRCHRSRDDRHRGSVFRCFSS